jgi:hypothetical protein
MTKSSLKLADQFLGIQGLVAAYAMAIKPDPTLEGGPSSHTVFMCTLPVAQDCSAGNLGDVLITKDSIQVKGHEGWTSWSRSHLSGTSMCHPCMEQRVLEYRPQVNMVTYATWNTTSNWQQEWDRGAGVTQLLKDWGRVCNLTDETKKLLEDKIESHRAGYRKIKVAEIASMIFLGYSGSMSTQVGLNFSLSTIRGTEQNKIGKCRVPNRSSGFLRKCGRRRRDKSS